MRTTLSRSGTTNYFSLDSASRRDYELFFIRFRLDAVRRTLLGEKEKMQLKAILKLSLFGIATVIAMTGAAVAQETKLDVGNTGQVGHPERSSVKIVAVESDAKVETTIAQNGGS